MISRRRQSHELNPFIPFTDLLVNLVIILGFSVASINVGWEMARYSEAQKTTLASVKKEWPNPAEQPYNYSAAVKNDPPGAQRWVFDQSQLFNGRRKLTVDGRNTLFRFAHALKHTGSDDIKQKYLWRRLRIEGHSSKTGRGAIQDMYYSSNMACLVYEYLAEHCGIERWYMSTSGRGSEDEGILFGDRVEIVVEYQGK